MFASKANKMSGNVKTYKMVLSDITFNVMYKLINRNDEPLWFENCEVRESERKTPRELYHAVIV